MGNLPMILTITSTLCWLMVIWVGMRGMEVRPEWMFTKLRRADVRTVYEWIDRVYYTEDDNLTIVMSIPILYRRRRVVFEFHFYRTLPKTVYFRGGCGWGDRKDIPVNLASAIRLHMFPNEFEFPEEGQ